jgi:hypothetical protein
VRQGCGIVWEAFVASYKEFRVIPKFPSAQARILQSMAHFYMSTAAWLTKQSGYRFGHQELMDLSYNVQPFLMELTTYKGVLVS